MKPVSLIIIGAGSRGKTYAAHAAALPELARVVAVADPREAWRDQVAALHSVPASGLFASWEEVAERSRFADAVVIATQDDLHLEPALRFAEKGYHILLEKPMAPDPVQCRRIVDAVVRHDVLFAVCHVLRYTGYTATMKQLLDSGAIGRLVSLQHLEQVGYWHQAHSFVRGNWRREDQSSPMLLAKSCHDLDWIRYMVGVPCTRISSFGSLVHFRPEHRPEGAAERCLQCGIEPRCPYSAKKLYLDWFDRWNGGWPLDVLTPEVTRARVFEALQTGPYGRCVYSCDNDVVDNQVVNMEFEGGLTASFVMTAFTEVGHRQTRLFGTHGMMEGDGEKIRVLNFVTDQTTEYDTNAAEGTITGGHGGGDYRLTRAFVEAVARGDRSLILSGPRETLESHLMVFAAEEARRQGCVVRMEEYESRLTPQA